MEIKTLTENDFELITGFEKELLSASEEDPVRAELMSWKAPWREESLNHYLPSGWSMGFFDPKDMRFLGYFLAQPLLFFRGLTQNLWIEHLNFEEGVNPDDIIDVAYRLSRSKHLQSVIFYNCESYANHLQSRKAEAIASDTYLIKTAKYT